ncbi:MAG: hypothetical protein Q9191_003242 [Dirinaria sp. TL-2023a]
MPPASSESQFAFLISCIRYSNNGKVDFTEVARECGIVSKGAAAKRYERMMKANGIHQSNQPIRETTIASTPRKRAENTSGSSQKKRKLDHFNDGNSNTDTGDDDEGLPKVKPEPVKAEDVNPDPTGAMIKEEPLILDDGNVSYPDETLDQGYQAHDNSYFDEFIQPSALTQPAVDEKPGYGGAFGQNGYDDFEAAPASEAHSGHDNSDTILITD